MRDPGLDVEVAESGEVGAYHVVERITAHFVGHGLPKEVADVVVA